MKKIIVWCVAALMLCQTPALAQLSAREVDIDLQLNAESSGSVAPPTGSQAVAPANGGVPDAFVFPRMLPSAKVVLGQTDKKARVYDVKGKVVWIKKGTPVEKKLRVNDMLEPGDSIRTEEKSSVSIAFDDSYMNAIHLPENTQAVIESIEPTDIRIENGAIYSAVNGLPQGGSWKVTTPAAVAAVRGTLYFVRYQTASGNFYAATVNIPDDGKLSAIEIQEISGSQSANVPEGKEISLTQGQAPDQGLVQDLDPDSLQEVLDFFEALVAERESRDGDYAPPTGDQGDNFDAENNDQGDSQNNLDQTDTGVVTEDNDPPTEPGAPPAEEEDPPIEDKPKKDHRDHDHRGHYDRNDRDHHDHGDRNDRDRDDHDRGDRDDRDRNDDDHGDRNDRDRDDDDRGGWDDNDRGDRNDRDRDDDDRGDRDDRDRNDDDHGDRNDRDRNDDDRGGWDDNDRGDRNDRDRNDDDHGDRNDRDRNDDDRGGWEDNDRGNRDDDHGDRNDDHDDNDRGDRDNDRDDDRGGRNDRDDD